MTLLIVILAVVFLVLTVMVISRTQSLLKGINKVEEKDDDISIDTAANSINAFGLTLFWVLCVIGVIWSFNASKDEFLISARGIWSALGDVPEAASEHGKVTDFWFWVSMIVITLAFLVVNSVLFGFATKYRYDKNRKAHFYPHNNTLEIIWTAIPAVIMAGLVFSGLMVWNKTMGDAPADAEVIEIMGKQFSWTVRYPGVDNNKLGNHNYKLIDEGIGNEMGIDLSDENSFDDFTNTQELHVPKGKPVLLKIRARDVLHSVFIPHLRVKMDAVPGMPTKFWFTATKTTAEMAAEVGKADFKYELACTEVCGRSHFGMKLIVVVDEPADYEKWKKEQKTFLAQHPEAIEKVPANLKAKAMKYLPVEEAPVATEVAAGGATPSASLK